MAITVYEIITENIWVGILRAFLFVAAFRVTVSVMIGHYIRRIFQSMNIVFIHFVTLWLWFPFTPKIAICIFVYNPIFNIWHFVFNKFSLVIFTIPSNCTNFAIVLTRMQKLNDPGHSTYLTFSNFVLIQERFFALPLSITLFLFAPILENYLFLRLFCVCSDIPRRFQ